MKYKTTKLINLEKQRKSILTKDMTVCYFCKKPKDDIHEIYGGKNRVISMQNNFCVPLCRLHHEYVHNNENWALELKRMCQEVFELTHKRKDFMQLIGKSYL